MGKQSQDKEKSADLAKVNAQLRAENELRKEFYRHVSHELATPLTPIVGYVSMLLNEEFGPLNKQQIKVLRAVNECTERLRAQIDYLIDMTALETGQISFVYKPYDVLDVVRRAVSAQAEKMADAGIELVTEFPHDPLPAFGDGDRLERVVQQLLDNARNVVPRDGRVGVRVRKLPASQIELYVADSGPGLLAEDLEQIFEPFFQIAGSCMRGGGFGLALVRCVAQALGGDAKALSHAVEPIDGVHFQGAAILCAHCAKISPLREKELLKPRTNACIEEAFSCMRLSVHTRSGASECTPCIDGLFFQELVVLF